MNSLMLALKYNQRAKRMTPVARGMKFKNWKFLKFADDGTGGLDLHVWSDYYNEWVYVPLHIWIQISQMRVAGAIGRTNWEVC